jgi:hypothetical protein
LCSLRHISPYWESVFSVWLPKALVRLQQAHNGHWVWSFLGEEAIDR